MYHFEIFVYFSCFWVNYHKKGGYPPQKGGVPPPPEGGSDPPQNPPKVAKSRSKYAKTQISLIWRTNKPEKRQFSCFSTLGGVFLTPYRITVQNPNLALFGFLGSNLTPPGGFWTPPGGGGGGATPPPRGGSDPPKTPQKWPKVGQNTQKRKLA